MQNGPRDEDILLFIEQHTGRKLGVLERADIFAALDLDGAKAETLMADYAKAFKVDMAGYEPAFHHRDAKRAGRFGWPVPIAPLFGVRMPLPVSTLALAARRGDWPLRYPLLTPRPVRDWINLALVLAALPILAAALIWLWRAF
ncbi:hypothetical protein [Pseudotabrizicola sp. L79]|uniref:hypothetical protein n=1 Tax=Pseudotabrizicola sp. L79 TaxID=3118402 RepID=UPI002F94E6FF